MYSYEVNENPTSFDEQRLQGKILKGLTSLQLQL